MAIVLVVEDEEDVAVMLCAALREEGHTAILASSGEQATDEAAAHGVEVVLLDLFMPYSGYRVAEDLRANPLTASLPIILLSAVHRVADAAKTIGTPYFLGKPYNLDALFALITQVMAPVAETT